MQTIPFVPSGPLASRISLGCWPMAGITSLGVTDEQSVQTVLTALEQGVNFFDTAYSYGYDGQSDRILAHALSGKRDQVIIAHKVGQHWNDQKERIIDGRPETLFRHAETCLKRLQCEIVDLMYLHCPDPNVSLRDSARAIASICERGWAKHAGVCNVNLEQALEFSEYCPTAVIQIPFNMLQQAKYLELRDFAKQRQIRLACYWVFMKGLLSGHMRRHHVLAENDRRRSYDIFHGQAWEKAHDLIDFLATIAEEKRCTIGQVVVGWTLAQPSVDFVLLGAKTPAQMMETAGANDISLTESDLARIDCVIASVA